MTVHTSWYDRSYLPIRLDYHGQEPKALRHEAPGPKAMGDKFKKTKKNK
jgi:hypothetical protein